VIALAQVKHPLIHFLHTKLSLKYPSGQDSIQVPSSISKRGLGSVQTLAAAQTPFNNFTKLEAHVQTPS
jgi:hypothetical protein